MNLISIVVPVYNESESITTLLRSLHRDVSGSTEVLLIYDFDEDTTLPVAQSMADEVPGIRLVKNEIGPGVLNALRTGLDEASGDVVCVVMADLSDDTTQIDELADLVRSGAAVAAASRYMKGGRQVGGPPIKRTLSRLAGLSLHYLAGLGTHDPTNNFKAYSSEFLSMIEIESTRGFELALELTVKAHLAGGLVVETPTTWTDRAVGTSRFQLLKWAPAYLNWYFLCLSRSILRRFRRTS